MAKESLTIDNLGIQASIRYAQDQQLYEPKYIEESRIIPQKTEIAALSPYIPSELDEFFSMARKTSWAMFSPPPNFFSYGGLLFSYQIIPSLGTQEKQEADADRLEHLEDALSKPKGKKKKGSKNQHQEEERERGTLLALFQCIKKLDKALALINARRNQYQRG